MLLRTRSCKTNSCYVVLVRKLRWGRPLLLTSTQASRTHVAHSCDTPSPTHGKVTPKKAVLSSPAGRHPTLAQSGWCTGTDRPLSPPLCLCAQLHRIYSETASEVGRGRCGGSVGPQGVCQCPPACPPAWETPASKRGVRAGPSTRGARRTVTAMSLSLLHKSSARPTPAVATTVFPTAPPVCTCAPMTVL